MIWRFRRLHREIASAGMGGALHRSCAPPSARECLRAHRTSVERAMCAAALIVGSYLLLNAAVASVPERIPPPRDTAYPGTIRLVVDATDLDHALLHVSETIPVHGPGPLVLLYPEWLPGLHSHSGSLRRVAGLVVRAGDVPLQWRRDPLNMYAFHLVVPAKTDSLTVEFQYLSATSGGEVTHDIVNLQWTSLVLYPAGYFSRRVIVEPSVALPEGWSFGTALETTSDHNPEAHGIVHFRAVDLEHLVDSPLFAGRFFRRFVLDDSAVAPVRLDVFADRPEQLEAAPEHIQAHRNLVSQAYKIFGPPAYKHYDFLLALSDELGGVGLEHLESSQNASTTEFFTGWNDTFAYRSLLTHEYAHSWCGKYRRPADLWTPTFNVPMQDSLLWVYEGQTTYWGQLLASRAGLITPQQNLDRIAIVAGLVDLRVGRVWRNLADTTNVPIINGGSSVLWPSWERDQDVYEEASLGWLEVDTLIRELSNDARSLDDFARRFFDAKNRSAPIVTYTFDDIVAALNRVQPYDWKKFFEDRLTSLSAVAPLDGLKRGGYRLIYTPTPSPYFVAVERRYGRVDLSWSLGLIVSTESGSAISEVQWGGPAFRAGLAPGTKIIAVNDVAYNSDDLKKAIEANRDGRRPIELIVRNGPRVRTVRIDYRDGLRYPRFERIPGTVDRLGQILAPRT
jgi:predicted metalloprotease with PDZ domain